MKKIITALSLLVLLSVTASAQRNNFAFVNTETVSKNKFQLFRGIGVKLGLTTNEYGWHHPDAEISRYYRDDPGMGTGGITGYIEMFSFRYLSTVFEIGYGSRSINLDRFLYDGNGNVLSTKELKNSFTLLKTSVTEKLKFEKQDEKGIFGAYIFGGIKYDNLVSSNIDTAFKGVLDNFNTGIWGAKIGFGAGGGSSFYFSAEFYLAADFTKTYSSSAGYFRNTEFGITVAFGYIKLK